VYSGYSLIVFIAVTVFCLARKGKGLFIVILCFVAMFLPHCWRYLSDDGVCDRFIIEITRLSFYLSLLCLVYQGVSWVIDLKKSKIKLS
jgi:hypothetical protein